MKKIEKIESVTINGGFPKIKLICPICSHKYDFKDKYKIDIIFKILQKDGYALIECPECINKTLLISGDVREAIKKGNKIDFTNKKCKIMSIEKTVSHINILCPHCEEELDLIDTYHWVGEGFNCCGLGTNRLECPKCGKIIYADENEYIKALNNAELY